MRVADSLRRGSLAAPAFGSGPAASLMAEAEREPIRWEDRGFQWDGDFWRYDYSIDDIWDVLES